MEAKAYCLTPESLQTYLEKATWDYWIVELPHRLVYKNPASAGTLEAGETLTLHCLGGRAFGPQGEFRWWRGERAQEIGATLIWDEGQVSEPCEEPQGEWTQEVRTDDRQCLVWGDRAGSKTGAWEDRARVLPEVDDWYRHLQPTDKYRGLKIRCYLHPETGELLLWRCVEPVAVPVQASETKRRTSDAAQGGSE